MFDWRCMFGHVVYSAAGFGVFFVISVQTKVSYASPLSVIISVSRGLAWDGPGHMALSGATACEPLVA